MSDIVALARDCANRHEARGNTDTADLLDNLADTIESLRAEVERLRVGWQPIGTAPTKTPVLVSYTSAHNQRRYTVIAEFWPENTLEWHPDAWQSDESDYAPQGWYVCNGSRDDDGPMYRTDYPPTHWRPVPQMSQAAAAAGEAGGGK